MDKLWPPSNSRFVHTSGHLRRPERFRIEVSHAHFWDITVIGPSDVIVLKLRRHSVNVEVICRKRGWRHEVERFAKQHKPFAKAFGPSKLSVTMGDSTAVAALTR
jgi:sulfate permease, SulP family